MNRTIKFRAWDKKNNRWYQLPSWGECEAEAGSVNGAMTLRDNKFFEWSQFTGLLDKNGKEIYEGDIVVIEEKNYEIEWQCGSFVYQRGYDFKGDADYIHFGFWMASNNNTNRLSQIEVIGNIKENPELLH